MNSIEYGSRAKLFVASWAAAGAAGALPRTFLWSRRIFKSPFFDFSAVNHVERKTGIQTSLHRALQHDPVFALIFLAYPGQGVF